MEISLCKLTIELLDDWLSYFDKDAFSDNDEWCGCYCMCYHWDSKLEKERGWDCGKDSAQFNRKQAINLIKNGRMQGYLAYAQGKVVGWCNSNNKKSYDLNHEMIETQIKYESAQELVEEYKEKINELQKKIIQLEANRTKEN